ncbi:hypothetical protein ERUR111494_03900 [Erysipelothrix urinaevulpis]|uniref:hypothetical protein n=1 Tax=Erysipelothrix urinaevulpis TaxID=2683717 RepID=UPI00135B4D43|nr:hypothetical protein [Erysipelothrix urinaevulpis]
MKKYSVVFAILVAMISFNSLLDYFNVHYNIFSSDVAYGRIIEKEINGLNFSGSTHYLDNPQEFFDNLVSVAEKYGDEIAIHSTRFDKYGEPVGRSFTNISDNSGYNSVFFDKDINDIQFNNKNETKYVTENVNSNDANATRMLRLPRSFTYNSRNKLEEDSRTYPIHYLHGDEINTIKTQFNVSYFSQSSLETIETIIFTEILNPYEFCGGVKCEDVYEFSNLLDTYQNETLNIFGSYNSLGSMPKKMFIVSTMLLVIIILYTSFEKSKEIMVRQLNGNNFFKIYFSTTLTDYLLIVGSFILTSIVLWVILMGGFDPLKMEFFKLIVQANIIFSLWIFVVYFGIFIIFNVFKSVKYLKTKATTNFFVFLAMIIKMSMILILMVPITTKFEEMQDFNQHRIARSLDPQTMNRTLLNEIVQPVFPFNHPKDASWDLNVNSIYMSIIEQYNLAIMSDVIEYPDDEYRNDVVYVNKEFIKPYQLRDTNGNLLDTNDFHEDVLLVPENFVKKENLEYITTQKIGIENAPQLRSEKASLLVDSSYPKMIHVLNDPKINFDYREFDVYYNQTSNENLYEIIKKISSEIGLVMVSNNDAKNQFFQTHYINDQILIMSLFAVVIILNVVISKLINRMMINNLKKKLTVQYIMGESRIKRYYPLIFSILVPSLVSVGIGVSQLYNRYRVDYNIEMDFTQLYWLLIALVSLDLFLIIYDMKKFEKKSVSEIIKGGDYQ